MVKRCLLWFRRDLRLDDNPALVQAVEDGCEIFPCFIWAEDENNAQGWPPGGATMVWIEMTLYALDKKLRTEFRTRLITEITEEVAMTLLTLCIKFDCECVYFNRRYEPGVQKLEKEVINILGTNGVRTRSFNSTLLYEPWDLPLDKMIEKNTRNHFGTLMPFVFACRELGPPRRPFDIPTDFIQFAKNLPANVTNIPALRLYIKPVKKDGTVVDWAKKIRNYWQPGEDEALIRMDRFLRHGLKKYETSRSRADEPNVSALSPYLAIGVISAHRLHWATKDFGKKCGIRSKVFDRRLAWRDLSYWQLHYFPRMQTEPIRTHHKGQKWNEDPEILHRWQKGKTGYPLIDAAMNQLWDIGWITQNVRMATASFLTEHVNMHWVEGERWYHDTLVDADIAINAMMWQSGGRSGLDMWNFIIDPVASARASDPLGKYCKTWLPLVKKLPKEYVHQPWNAPEFYLMRAGIRLGDNYPHRIKIDAKRTQEEYQKMLMKAGPQYKNQRGYDMITLPNGVRVHVFTRWDMRVQFDRNGRPHRPNKPKSNRLSGSNPRTKKKAPPKRRQIPTTYGRKKLARKKQTWEQATMNETMQANYI